MKVNDTPAATEVRRIKLTRGLIALFAFCCAAIVGNLYYAQPIIGLIAPDVHLSTGSASLIVSLTQIGYACGMFFLVPIGDLVENRKLLLLTASFSIACLATASVTHQPYTFLAVSLVLGFSTVTVQILVPLAAHLAPDESRGEVIGTIMGGLLLGILLARPISSFIAANFGWRSVYGTATVVMTLATVLLASTMPRRQPTNEATYGQLLRCLARWPARCLSFVIALSIRRLSSPRLVSFGQPFRWS